MEKSKDQTPIFPISEANSLPDERFEILKKCIIESWQEREGTWHINFAAAHDEAEYLASRLPSNVVLQEKDQHGPEEPSWFTAISICFVVFLFTAIAYIIMSNA
jgi:hypothetical protein